MKMALAIRVVFTTIALGMGVNFVGLNRTIRYGAPTAIEDYFQESGRAGRLIRSHCQVHHILETC